MWVCRKCKTQADRASKICRACGGILEEVPDARPFAGNTPVIVADVVSASPPAPVSTVARANDVSSEAGPISAEKAAARDWKCPKCGEIVPGNFDLCWKCMTSKEGEPATATAPVLAEVVEVDADADPVEPQPSAVQVEGHETPVQTRCPRCNSTKIMSGVTIVDQGEGSNQKLQTVIAANPEALIFKDRLYGELRADICGECGHVELRVANPKQLYRHYQKSRGLDRPFNRRQLPAIPCQKCHILMPTGSCVCPHCGASQAEL